MNLEDLKSVIENELYHISETQEVKEVLDNSAKILKENANNLSNESCEVVPSATNLKFLEDVSVIHPV